MYKSFVNSYFCVSYREWEDELYIICNYVSLWPQQSIIFSLIIYVCRFLLQKNSRDSP